MTEAVSEQVEPPVEIWLELSPYSVLCGDAEVLAYHRRRGTASYHCVGCGGNVDGRQPYPCRHCRGSY